MLGLRGPERQAVAGARDGQQLGVRAGADEDGVAGPAAWMARWILLGTDLVPSQPVRLAMPSST